MQKCMNCSEDTKNKKYCSKSCAAKVNNKTTPKRVKPKTPECAYCGKSVNTVKAKYCSLECCGSALSEDTTSRKLKEWFTNGNVNHWTAKKWILEQQDHKCSICGMPDEWNDQPLVFVLDHIDGNSNNNWRDNLRCVCPNCDSQLPTFAGRNRGSGRHYRRQRYAEGKSY